MFGFFKGLFGHGTMGKAAEAALEMCIIDEVEADADAACKRAEQQVEQAERAYQKKCEEVWEAEFRANMNLIRELSYELEQAAGMQEVLGIKQYLPAFYCSLFYDVICEVGGRADQKAVVLTDLLACCPESYVQSGKELIDHMNVNDEVGQLIRAMRSYPLVVLDLAHKSGRQQGGNRFLETFGAGVIAAGELCDCRYPGLDVGAAARLVGDRWLAQL